MSFEQYTNSIERETNEKQAENLLMACIKRFSDGQFRFKPHKWLSLYPEKLQEKLQPYLLQGINKEQLQLIIEQFGNTFEPCEEHLFVARQLIQFQNAKIEDLMQSRDDSRSLMEFKKTVNNLNSNVIYFFPSSFFVINSTALSFVAGFSRS